MFAALVRASAALAAVASAPAPAPAPAPGGFEILLRPIRHVTTREPTVAITFDACATKTHGYGFDRAVFEVIKREQIPATIFVSGRWVEFHPDAMAELAGEPLIEFGDHSYDHPHMSNLASARIAEEIDQTEATLARYGKKSVAFRPPFGSWSRRVLHVVQDHQLPLVTWDVVSGDPSAKTTTEGMIRAVVGKARPGSIIIFHINGRGLKTAEALPEILHELRARGFRFVPLSELLASGREVPAQIAAAPPPAVPPEPLPAAAADESGAPQLLPPGPAPALLPVPAP